MEFYLDRVFLAVVDHGDRQAGLLDPIHAQTWPTLPSDPWVTTIW